MLMKSTNQGLIPRINFFSIRQSPWHHNLHRVLDSRKLGEDWRRLEQNISITLLYIIPQCLLIHSCKAAVVLSYSPLPKSTLSLQDQLGNRPSCLKQSSMRRSSSMGDHKSASLSKRVTPLSIWFTHLLTTPLEYVLSEQDPRPYR